VQTRGYYRTPVHRQTAMLRWGQRAEPAATHELARSNLALPMSPVLGADGAREVVEAVSKSVEDLG
jgi:dTDP-4-amino-4,6-dideoxygalactose transaminase